MNDFFSGFSEGFFSSQQVTSANFGMVLSVGFLNEPAFAPDSSSFLIGFLTLS